jgi:hypothetical protein
MNISCREDLIEKESVKNDETSKTFLVLNLVLNKSRENKSKSEEYFSKKYPIEGEIKDITKIGGDSVIGGIYSGTIKIKLKDENISDVKI